MAKKPATETPLPGPPWLPAAAAAVVFVVLRATTDFHLVVSLGVAAVIYAFLVGRPHGRPIDLYLAENVEAIMISIAMALILKFFVIEAYQIPTGSMQPTILGDRTTGIMDRILADKLITMLRPPERWEVMIFRFPLDERRLYVKRIVGLPGESLSVRGGDVWVDGAIARKPDRVNDSVLKQIVPNDGEGMEVSRFFSASEGVRTTGTTAEFPADGDGELVLRRRVTDDYLHGYDPSWGIAPSAGNDHAVADLDLSLTATLADGASELRLLFESDDGDVTFVLPRAGSGGVARAERQLPGRAPLVIPMKGALPGAADGAGHDGLPAGRPVEITARNVDRQLVLWVDGELWLRWDDDEAGPRTDTPSMARLAIQLDGGGEVSGIDVRRDIFYTPTTRSYEQTVEAWEIPDDSYFGMGDNTQNSHDGRTWQTKTYELRDGQQITGFWFPPNAYGPVQSDANPMYLPDGKLAFADVHGDTHRFDRDEVVAERLESAPFINQRYLLGKASVVFWPVAAPFRWKLIR